jgi:NAD(P)-dependent dehydrogenase (short-subunit alcohol dehydrogenase family)
MTSSWSKELKDRGISVNSLSPGMVDTRSFPKAPGKPGVRTSESIRDCLLFALSSTASGMKYTGHYVHADEYDHVRELGLPDVTAWKYIDEPPFQPS